MQYVKDQMQQVSKLTNQYQVDKQSATETVNSESIPGQV